MNDRLTSDKNIISDFDFPIYHRCSGDMTEISDFRIVFYISHRVDDAVLSDFSICIHHCFMHHHRSLSNFSVFRDTSITGYNRGEFSTRFLYKFRQFYSCHTVFNLPNCNQELDLVNIIGNIIVSTGNFIIKHLLPNGFGFV